MHNHDDKYPSRPGFEPGTTRLQAPADTNEPSGPARSPREQRPRKPVINSETYSMPILQSSVLMITKEDASLTTTVQLKGVKLWQKADYYSPFKMT